MTEEHRQVEHVDPTLLWLLRRAGDEWGPLGVALTAAHLSDPAVVVSKLRHLYDLPSDSVDPLRRPVPVDDLG